MEIMISFLSFSEQKERGRALMKALLTRIFASKMTDKTEIKEVGRAKSYLKNRVQASFRTMSTNTGNIT